VNRTGSELSPLSFSHLALPTSLEEGSGRIGMSLRSSTNDTPINFANRELTGLRTKRTPGLVAKEDNGTDTSGDQQAANISSRKRR